MRSESSFDGAVSSSSGLTPEDVVLALTYQTRRRKIEKSRRARPMRRTAFAKYHIVVRGFGSRPLDVAWLSGASEVIASQTTAQALRSAADEIRRRWNLKQSSELIEVSRKLLDMFYRDPDHIGVRNPVHIGRVILDVKHWESDISQMIAGVCVLARSRQLPEPALMQVMAYLTEHAPDVHVGNEYRVDDSISDLDVFLSTKASVRVAPSYFTEGNDRFCALMCKRLTKFLGLSIDASNCASEKFRLKINSDDGREIGFGVGVPDDIGPEDNVEFFIPNVNDGVPDDSGRDDILEFIIP